MSTYLSPWRKSGGIFWRTICFTGWHEWMFRAMAVGLGAAEGFLIGAFIGIVVTAAGAASTAELPPLAALVVLAGAGATQLGALLGAGIGGFAGALLAYLAGCPSCGSCIEIAFYQILGGRMMPVVPFIILPRTGDCTLIPPGCP